MKATTLNSNTYSTVHAAKNTGNKVSLTDKIRNYWQENSKSIACALMSLNTNADAYAIYKMFN